MSKKKKATLLSQSNPDINVLGRITIDIYRDDGEPWVYTVEDDAGPLEMFTDLNEAVDFVKRTIEDSARCAAMCESLRTTWRAPDKKPATSGRRHLRLVRG